METARGRRRYAVPQPEKAPTHARLFLGLGKSIKLGICASEELPPAPAGSEAGAAAAGTSSSSPDSGATAEERVTPDGDDDGVDEGLYSRQLYALGRDTQRRLRASKVLVVGLPGAAAEACKNLALSGVGCLTLHDRAAGVGAVDRQTNCFVAAAPAEEEGGGGGDEEEVEGRRAIATCRGVSELNPAAEVRLLLEEADLTEAVTEHDVVLLAGLGAAERGRLAAVARAAGKAVVAADACGQAGYVFCDFGDGFSSSDPDGEPPRRLMVGSVDRGGTVTLLDPLDAQQVPRHEFKEGDLVRFEGLRGMEGLNGQVREVVDAGDAFSFGVGDASGEGHVAGTGWAVEVKRPAGFAHAGWDEAAADGGRVVGVDWANPGRDGQVRDLFRCLDAYRAKGGVERDDSPLADHLATCAQELCLDLDLAFLREFDRCRIATRPGPMHAFLGGVAAQEVMKACSGKFSPLSQWAFFHATELASAVPADTDGSHQSALENARILVAGAGAIGCELLKNLALLGAGSGASGRIFVADADRIERSNLSRQFLFRQADVGRPKAAAAAEAVAALCPGARVTPLEARLGPETESGPFDDAFWGSLDLVANALDNVEARLYVDGRCVRAGKPMVDSGTLGTKGNVQVVLPHLTESYGASSDPPAESIPLCTLRWYPHKLEHCLHWARALLEDTFGAGPAAALRAASAPAAAGMDAHQLREAAAFVADVAEGDFVGSARRLWERLFRHDILQLLSHFPPDSVGSSGRPFWSPPRYCPAALEFDPGDPDCLEFVRAAAALRAFNVGVPDVDGAVTAAALAAARVVPFVPRSDVVIPEDDEDDADRRAAAGGDGGDPDPGAVAAAVAALPAGYTIQPVEFEKDDDTNHHMQFVLAAANLRARNYSIPPTDMSNAKLVAGRIIPALATTTSVVAGLASIEIQKILYSNTANKDVSAFRNSFVNLALPLFAFSEPVPPAPFRSLGRTWTQWDHLDLGEGASGLTVGGILAALEERHGVTGVAMAALGTTLVYADWLPEEKRARRLGQTLREVVEEVTGGAGAAFPTGAAAAYLSLAVEGEEEEEVEVPDVRIPL